MFGVGMRIPLTGPLGLLIGMICLGVASYLFLTSSSLITDGVATEAKVVDTDSRLGSDRRTYALILEFTDRDGVSHRERTGYSWRHRWTRTGEQLPILYNPLRPSEFAIDGWYGLWMMPLTFLAFGVAGCAGFLLGPHRRDRAV